MFFFQKLFLGAACNERNNFSDGSYKPNKIAQVIRVWGQQPHKFLNSNYLFVLHYVSICPGIFVSVLSSLAMHSISFAPFPSIDHIDYIGKVAGIDHVGIGSDFDGIPW